MATKPTDAVNRINAANGNAYDATNNPGGLAQGGHRQNFVPDLQATVSVAQWSADSAAEAAASAVATAADRVQTGQDRIAASNSAAAAAQSVTDAAGQVTLASNQVTLAAAQAQRLAGTSSTSQTPSVASKTFTTQADKAFDVGSYVFVQSRGTLNRWMFGRVTAYSNTSLTVSVEAIGTTVTAGTDWDIRVSGVRGAQGIQGIAGIATMPYTSRTSNTALSAGDSASIVDLSGTFTQTFASAATLGANWFVYIRNVGTGVITLSGVDSGNPTMIAGEIRIVQSDGTSLRSFVLNASGKGQPNGFATLNANSKVPITQTTSFGEGQTFQAVTRTPGVSYQNTTGRDILVQYQNTNNARSTLSISSNNSSFFIIEQSEPLSGLTASGIVPNGFYYQLNGGTQTVTELR